MVTQTLLQVEETMKNNITQVAEKGIQKTVILKQILLKTFLLKMDF